MEALEQLTEQLAGGQDLSVVQAYSAAAYLAQADVSLEAKQAFLTAFSVKGETGEEVAAFASAFRERAIDPGVQAWADRAIDVCGTGGDQSNTFNISTAVSFILAAAGVPVLKHGNRSITSKCGSADLLEGLGIRLELSHQHIRESLEALNFCFFYAPAYHPAFKEIMPVRRAMAAQGQRSIFNLLGPLINPGCPAYQLLGVYAAKWVEPLASALGKLELAAGLVVHGIPEPGSALDELSCAGTNRMAGFGKLGAHRGELRAEDGGLSPCAFSTLRGGDLPENLALLHTLVGGDATRIPSGLRDTVLLNAGAALWASGQADDLKEGIRISDALLREGSVAAWLDRARAFNAECDVTHG